MPNFEKKELTGYRFNKVLSVWRKLVGNIQPVYMDNPTYLSERENADRNWAIAYFLKESNAFPPNTDIKDAMDFYLQ